MWTRVLSHTNHIRTVTWRRRGPRESDEDSELEGPSLLYDTYAHDARRTEAAAKRMRAAADLLAAAQGRVVRDRDALQAMRARGAVLPDWIQTPSRNAVGIFELELETLANACRRTHGAAPTRWRPTRTPRSSMTKQAPRMHNREFARPRRPRGVPPHCLAPSWSASMRCCRPEAAVRRRRCAVRSWSACVVQWCECVASLVREAHRWPTLRMRPCRPWHWWTACFGNPPRTLQQCALPCLRAHCCRRTRSASRCGMARGATPWADTNTALDEARARAA